MLYFSYVIVMGGNMDTKERIYWIDVAKGYGILLVILGHLNTNLIKYELYTFHIPLFFFLAGYVFHPEKYTFKELLKKKLRTLILPYFFMGSIITISMWISHGFLTLKDLTYCILKLLIQNRFQAIWFLTCLFFTEILSWILFILCKGNKSYILLVSTVTGIIGLLYYRLGGMTLFWNIDVCMTAIFFFSLGYFIRGLRENKKWMVFIRRKSTFIIAITLHFSCSVANHLLCQERLDMFYCQYGFVPVMVVASLTGIYVVYRISLSKNIRCISYLGRHSLIYFGLHNALSIPLLEIIYSQLDIFQNPVGIDFFLYLLVSISFVLFSMTLADFVFRNTRLRIFLGMRL